METISRKDIGKILEKEYADDDSKHIKYFYFIFKARNEGNVKKTVTEAFTMEDAITCHYLVDDMSVESQTGESMFVYFVKYEKGRTERHREKTLEDISTIIKEKISTKVMITRACKYTSLKIN